MTTTLVKTIGTGGDYSTPQAWEDACPADLTSVDQIWRGELLNQEFTSASSTVLTMTGTTQDATRYKELSVAAGASIFDNVANPLRYDGTKGAGIKVTYTGSYGGRVPVVIAESYARISRVQIAFTGSNSASQALTVSGASGYHVIDSVLAETSGTTEAVTLSGVGSPNEIVARNLIAVQRHASASYRILGAPNTKLYNCTLVSVNGTKTNGVGVTVSGAWVNVALFGCSSVGSVGMTASNCYTNASSPPSGFTTIAFDTTTGSGFLSKTNGSHDLRLGSGSALINAGTSSGAPATDAYGQSRSGSYDVGAFEYIVVGSSFSPTWARASQAGIGLGVR